MSNQSVTISISRNDVYTTTEKAEIKIEIPDAEIAAVIYSQLRNDIRRMEDGIRERVTTLMMPPPSVRPTPPPPPTEWSPRPVALVTNAESSESDEKLRDDD